MGDTMSKGSWHSRDGTIMESTNNLVPHGGTNQSDRVNQSESTTTYNRVIGRKC